METYEITGKQVLYSNSKSESKPISTFWEAAEFNRFGIITMAILAIGCIGGIAVGFGGIINSTFQLAVTAVCTTMSLSFILAVAPMRLIIGSCSLAIVLDILFSLINLI